MVKIMAGPVLIEKGKVGNPETIYAIKRQIKGVITGKPMHA